MKPPQSFLHSPTLLSTVLATLLVGCSENPLQFIVEEQPDTGDDIDIGAIVDAEDESVLGLNIESAAPDQLTIRSLPPRHKDPLVYDESFELRNDLEGDLQGQLDFVQSHTSSLHKDYNTEQLWPDVLAKRSALVLFSPIEAGLEKEYTLEVLLPDGTRRNLPLLPPAELPESDQSNDDHRQAVVYSDQAHSARIQGGWMKPNFTYRVKASTGETGQVPSAKVHMRYIEQDVVLLKVGLRHPYSGLDMTERNWPYALADLYSKWPFSQLNVVRYEPKEFDHLVYPDGTVKNDQNPVTTGGNGYHSELRSKFLNPVILRGVKFAWRGQSGVYEPKLRGNAVPMSLAVRATAEINTTGGVQHGSLGGGRIGWTSFWVGNQFMHEVGHGFNLGHGSGGVRTVHSLEYNSRWGWNDFHRRFLGNLDWNNPAIPSADLRNNFISQPFAGQYRFNTDPLWGGASSGRRKVFSAHTPVNARMIQNNYRNDRVSVVDGSIAKWNLERGRLDPISGTGTVLTDNQPIITVIGHYDPLQRRPGWLETLHANLGPVFDLPPRRTADACWVWTRSANGEYRDFRVDQYLKVDKSNAPFSMNLAASEQWSSVGVSCGITDATLAAWLGSTVNRHATNVGEGNYNRVTADGTESVYRQLKAGGGALPNTGESNAHWEYTGSIAELNSKRAAWCLKVAPRLSESFNGRSASEFSRYEKTASSDGGLMYTLLADGTTGVFEQRGDIMGARPVSTETNASWLFKGRASNIIARNNRACNNVGHDSNSVTELMSVVIEPSVGNLPAIQIGGGRGFEDVQRILHDRSFAQGDGPVAPTGLNRGQFRNLRDADAAVVDHFGAPVDEGNGLRRVVEQNDIAYFHELNGEQKLLGRATELVEQSPLPLAFYRGEDFDHIVATINGQSDILEFTSLDKVVKNGVYKNYNPSLQRHEYFKAKVRGRHAKDEFSIDGSSNYTWAYLGDENQYRENTQDFEWWLRRYYNVDQTRSPGEVSRAGDLYRVDGESPLYYIANVDGVTQPVGDGFEGNWHFLGSAETLKAAGGFDLVAATPAELERRVLDWAGQEAFIPFDRLAPVGTLFKGYRGGAFALIYQKLKPDSKVLNSLPVSNENYTYLGAIRQK